MQKDMKKAPAADRGPSKKNQPTTAAIIPLRRSPQPVPQGTIPAARSILLPKTAYARASTEDMLGVDCPWCGSPLAITPRMPVSMIDAAACCERPLVVYAGAEEANV